MSLFVYEAIDDDGRLVTSEINSLNKEEVVNSLTQKHLTPIKIELKGINGSISPIASKALFESFTALDKIILVRNLAATIKAGLSLSEALEILVADTTKNVVKTFLLEAQLNVLNGQPLSRVFEKNSKYFSPIFVGMIKAGESSGRLDKSLEELNRHLNREYRLVKKIKAALTYPIILIVATIGIVVVMLTFVLPKLSKSFAQNNVKLPPITQILVNISNVLTFSPILDVIFLFGIIGGIMYFRKSATG